MCIKTHTGYNQEAYDAEYAALVRALESVSRGEMTPERVSDREEARTIPLPRQLAHLQREISEKKWTVARQ